MNKSISGSLILLLFSIISFNGFTQTGSLKGIVKDETGQPAFDITVYIPSVKLGAVTELEGEYQIENIPAGTYKVILRGVGYKADTITGVVINSGATTTLDKTIYSNNAIVIDIVEQKDQGNIATQIEDVKNNDKVVSQLGGEQIRQGSDRNAADALRRLPGVTLVDNRFIMVRGLSERYNTVWLNDAGAPSAEPDRKAFSFDIIQSQLIDKIQIFKTPAPDLPGDFAGGMAKIYTRASAPKREFQISFQSSYRAGSTLNNFNYSERYSLDKFGFGAKDRSLPKGLPDYIYASDANNADVTKLFKNSWALNEKKASPDIRFSVLYANRFRIFKKLDLGNTSAINYSNLNTVFKIKRFDWDSTAQTAGNLDNQSTNLVNLGMAQNLSLIINKNHTLQFRNLFNQTGRTQTTLRDDVLLTNGNQKTYIYGYQNRSVFTSQLSGTHGNDTIREYRWTAGFAYSNRKDPDLRRVSYVKDRTEPDSMYHAQIAAGNVDPRAGGGRFYSNLFERTYTFNHNFKQRIKIANYKFDLMAGNYLEYKERSFQARVLGYTIVNPGATSYKNTFLPINQLFGSSSIGDPSRGIDGFNIAEMTTPSDSYKAQNKLVASYAAVTLPFANRFKLLTGVRYEYNVQSLQSYVNTNPVSPTITTNFLLPSANLTYKFSDKSLLRLAAGKTLNRPEFREWSPFGFYDYEFNAFTYGSLFPTLISATKQNPNPATGSPLKVAQIMNYDLRYELYPSALEMFHVGAFYKSFTNPVQQVILVGGDSRQFTFTNAVSAYSYGVELDIRKNLGFADSLLGTKFFGKVNLVGNASLIKSQVYNENVINQQKKNPLPGQSPYVFNTGVYYQAGSDSTGIQFTLLYNIFGPRVFFVGTNDYPNIGEMPRNTLDLTINKSFSKKFSMVLSIQDLLNQPVMLVQDTNRDGKFTRPGKNFERDNGDKPIMNFRRGQYFTLGLRFNL